MLKTASDLVRDRAKELQTRGVKAKTE